MNGKEKKKSLGEMMGWSKSPLDRAKKGRESQKKKAKGYGKKKAGEKSYFGL